MKDFSHWRVYDGASEGSGRSEKIWLIEEDSQQIGLFKFKKDEGTTDHISECIAYQLARLLEIECAQFELGIYNGREGSMSYSVLTKANQNLIEGINYINNKYPQYDINQLKDRESGKVYSLEMIKESLPDCVSFDKFLVIPLFDYLIGNTDRHQNNWALISENGSSRLSPLYDNSSSLCAYMKENELKSCLGNDAVKWRSVVDTKSKSIIRITADETKRPTHLEVLQYIKENYYEETQEIVYKILNIVNEENIDKILGDFDDSILSQNKKKVIKKFLISKVIKMNEVYFEKEKENVD